VALFKGAVKGGELLLPSKALARLQAFEGKAVAVDLDEWSDSRSGRQNRYYWGVVVPHSVEALRYLWGAKLTKQAAADALRTMFLGKQTFGCGKVEVVRSSAGLTMAEFSAYIDTIRAWALDEAQIVIPTPEELGWNQ
jgi:hypothetical protein